MKNKLKSKKNKDMIQARKELERSINKNYSNEPDGSFALLIILLVGLGMIIYGGFTKNWTSIVSGVLLVGIVSISA